MYNRRMITLAREARGLTQEQLSKELENISQAALSNIESGKIPAKDSEIAAIAKALSFPIAFFEMEKNTQRLSKFYYRKRSTFPVKELNTLEAKIDVIRHSYEELLKTVDIPIRELPRIPVAGKHSPESIADYLRVFFNLDDGPIDNPIHLIEKCGIPIFYLDVPSDKFSGMTIQTHSNFYALVVNKNMPNDHKKFTLMHELGHLVMHIPFTDDPEFSDLLSDFDKVEQQADQFAAAFLVPSTKAKATLRPFTYSKLTPLKLFWKVSKQMLIIRAKDLGIIDSAKYKNIYIELSRNGERKREKFDIEIDQPSLLRKIINVHIQDLNYSKVDLAEKIAKINLEDFEEWFSGIRKSSLKIA